MKKTGRLIVVLLVLLICGIFLYPSIKWYAMTPQSTKVLATGSNSQIREYARGEATKDLKILKALVLKDVNANLDKKYSYLKSIAKQNYKDAGASVPSNWTVGTVLNGFSSETALYNTLEAHYRDELLYYKKLSTNVLQLGLDLRGGMSILLEADTDAYTKKTGKTLSNSEVSTLIGQDIEILQKRIDQFGVSEPEIRKQGTNQITVEIPGAANPERVDSFLKGKGSLTFQIVDKELTGKLQDYFLKNPSKVYDDKGKVIKPDFIPVGKMVSGYYTTDEYGLDKLEKYVVLDSEIGLDGSHLESATTSTDSITGRPTVNFKLDNEGGEIFYKLTSNHVKDTLSVVMDGKVKAMATITGPIRNSVQITGFNEKEARDLSIVLKTASLPIELSVLNQSQVSASLGSDLVAIGLKSGIIGLILVFIFMVVYYRRVGLIADLALLLNIVIMMAVLGAIDFTMTLTSIAGLVLTIGMAVDANVIIFERIKEELREGKNSKASVKSGFGKAFWAIVDSNITTIIAAIILSQFGSGSVKGFANTLAIGILSSMFTALFVSHLIFDAIVDKNKDAKLRITWRKK